MKSNLEASIILDSIGEGVAVINVDNKIIYFNKKSAQLTAYSAKYAIGKNYDQVLKIASEDCGKINNSFIKDCVVEGESVKINGSILVRKDGSQISVSVKTEPMKDPAGKIIGCVVVIEDTTETKEIDKIKNKFVSLASHQLRIPLTAIRLFSDLLVSKDSSRLSRQQKDYIKLIQESVIRIIASVKDLTNIARLRDGKVKIYHQPTNFRDLIDQEIVSSQALAKETKCKIVFYSAIKKPLASLDPDLFAQVLRSLFNNAISYSSFKQSQMIVKLESANQDYKISVKDNGIGIAKNAQPYIFDLFFRAKNAGELVPNGNGLGLYAAKKIMDDLGGKIWFQSKLGQGSTFFLSVPKQKKT